MNGHTKDNYPLLANYMQAGGPIPLRPREAIGPSGSVLWCDDCRVVGLHDTNHWPCLAAYVPEINKKQLIFCKSIGNDEQNYQTYDLMIDRGNIYIGYNRIRPRQDPPRA